MHTSTRLLDQIELNDGRIFIGIIDFVSTKQIYVFDFTREPKEEFILLAILWKGYNPELRFSVYCSINYPDIRLPRAILIPKNHITSTDKEVQLTKPNKTKKKIIKN
jgi:hypothetical protein